MVLHKVLGFSRAMCFGCHRSGNYYSGKPCAGTYDEMAVCYEALLKDQETPELKGYVDTILERIDEYNKG